MSNYRKVEKLVKDKWVEITKERALSTLVRGDRFKLYESDGTLVDNTAYVAIGAPYQDGDVWGIGADSDSAHLERCIL